ncbi:ABC transporter permease [Oleiharenicola lentus]|uniref:ABC transporter permease n=1 Tax=Oleiharenicola lentus TaxID=2508720 RepID=UPI003F672436
MRRFYNEFVESFRIALSQIRANKMRSILTALGVIIGIVAVTLMGTAIRGIDTGFQNSLSMLGDDVVYVQKWPWMDVEDWWNYANRPNVKPQDAEKLNRIINETPNSLLDVAVPVVARSTSVKRGDAKLSAVFTIGTNGDYARITAAEYREGRLFNDTEANSGREVCVLGYDVAEALFPNASPLDQTVMIGNHPFLVIGVFAKQGEFLGMFSFDNQTIIPLLAFQKYFGTRRGAELRVKIVDKNRVNDAKEELVGAMRRVRGQLPGERDNFSLNEQQAFKAQLEPVKAGIAFAGLFITGLSLFVGAIGIMNITFVSVKERTKEIGTRKALGARRRSILMQFLIEAVSICLIGGTVGMVVSFGLFTIVSKLAPSFPAQFSPDLVLVSMTVSVVTGIVSGFAPAWGASRLDPVVALRYE